MYLLDATAAVHRLKPRRRNKFTSPIHRIGSRIARRRGSYPLFVALIVSGITERRALDPTAVIDDVHYRKIDPACANLTRRDRK